MQTHRRVLQMAAAPALLIASVAAVSPVSRAAIRFVDVAERAGITLLRNRGDGTFSEIGHVLRQRLG
jgi:hypothetical protein